MGSISELLGKTLESIRLGQDAAVLEFQTADGEQYRMFHRQECCEVVTVEDVNGNLGDLLGSPILMAEEVSEKGSGPEGTWTFYKIATVKGTVTVRWYGVSNGYYSESVDFERVL